MSTEKPVVPPVASSHHPRMPRELGTFCWTVGLISIVTLLYCTIMLLVFHQHYPYDWPFFTPEVRFSDFTIYQQKFTLFFHQTAFFTSGFPFTYPAPTAVLFEVFYKLGHDALRVFLLFIVLAFLIPAILFGRALVKRGLSPVQAAVLTAIGLCLSWPILLLFDRANAEVFVWICLVIATWAYSRGKEWTAAAWFGVAASLKLFPFVYLALFLTRRKFPKLLWGILVLVLVTVVSLAILGPTIGVAQKGISEGLLQFHKMYMERYLPNESGLDHTILAGLKVIVVTIFHPNHRPVLMKLVAIYLPASVVGGLLLYFLRIRKMPRLNQLILLSIASIYVTPFSGDGTLIHLYYGFALCCFLAIDAWKRGIRIPGLEMIFLCYGYILAIEGFVVIQGIRFEGQLKCIALGLLMIAALRYPLGPAPVDSEEGENLAYPDATKVVATI